MRLAIRSTLLVPLAAAAFSQDSKPQSAPPKQNGNPPAVMSPKATIPSPVPAAHESNKTAVETDPVKMGATPGRPKAQELPLTSDKVYVIGPEDGLRILVCGDQRLRTEYGVRADGRISMPLACEFRAADKTPEQLTGKSPSV